MTSGAEQAHRDPAGVELGGPAAVEPELEAGALEAGEERHAVAEVVARARGPARAARSPNGARASSERVGRGRPRAAAACAAAGPGRPVAGRASDQRMGDGEREPGGGGEPQQVDEVGQRLADGSLVVAADRRRRTARAAQPPTRRGEQGRRDDGRRRARRRRADGMPGGPAACGPRRRGAVDAGATIHGGASAAMPPSSSGGHPALRVIRAIQTHADDVEPDAQRPGTRGRLGW